MNPISMKKPIYLIATALLAYSTQSYSQVFPLSENTWKNPEFVQRFMGSYGFDTSVTPSITTEEQELFQTISTMIEANPLGAIDMLVSAMTPESSAALIYTIGNLYLQQEQADKAKEYYLKAIEAFPNFLRAYKNLGIVYVQEGNYESGAEMLLKSLELGGQGSDTYGLLGYSYLNQGNAVAGLSAYENALFFAPKSKDWRMGKLQCLSNLNRYDDAIALVDGLIEEFPQQSDLLLLQANAFIAKDEPENAAASLEILRSRGDADSNALTLLGDIYLKFQQPDLALESYRGVAEDSALSSKRALRIARRLASSAAWPQVDDFLKIVDANMPSNFSSKDSLDLLNLKAQSDLAQNRNAEAAVKLAKVVEQDPMNGKALLLLANYYWTEQDIERAEIYYERAAKVSEVAPDALVQNARMLVGIREYKKAVPLLERAQLLDPKPYVGQYLEKVREAARASR